MVKWEQKSFGFEALVGDGALLLIVFYEHGWKAGINDRAIGHEYPSAEVAKQVCVNWAREKLKIIEAELRELEKPFVVATATKNLKPEARDTVTQVDN